MIQLDVDYLVCSRSNNCYACSGPFAKDIFHPNGARTLVRHPYLAARGAASGFLASMGATTSQNGKSQLRGFYGMCNSSSMVTIPRNVYLIGLHCCNVHNY